MQNALLQPQQSIFYTALKTNAVGADFPSALNNTNVKGRVKTLPYKKRL